MNNDNNVETKPITLTTKPAGSDIIYETFAQKDIPNKETKNDSSQK